MLLSASPSSDCKTGLFGFQGRDGVDWSVRAVEGDGPTDLSPRASAGQKVRASCRSIARRPA
jgi:hypothetical protein